MLVLAHLQSNSQKAEPFTLYPTNSKIVFQQFGIVPGSAWAMELAFTISIILRQGLEPKAHWRNTEAAACRWSSTAGRQLQKQGSKSKECLLMHGTVTEPEDSALFRKRKENNAFSFSLLLARSFCLCCCILMTRKCTCVICMIALWFVIAMGC